LVRFLLRYDLIKIKRVYKKPSKKDRERILVDRLWPRGLAKQKARVNLWLKDLGPSTELRKWFGHDPKKWNGFAQKYRRELKTKKDFLREIKTKARKRTVTLVYGARDTEHNEALVLRDYLKRRL
jgi:uncharacterized protein YeaO (DUF488 family)